MRYINYYIQNNLLYHFREMRDYRIQRNRKLENEIALIHKIEWILRDKELLQKQPSKNLHFRKYRMNVFGNITEINSNKPLEKYCYTKMVYEIMFKNFNFNIDSPLIFLHEKNTLEQQATDHEKAIINLEIKYKEAIEKIRIKEFQTKFEAGNFVRHFIDEDTIYHYLDNCKYYNFTYLVKYVDNKKIILTQFEDKNGTFLFCPGSTTKFLNEYLLGQQDSTKQIIILTDSIELADLNHTYLTNNSISKEILWIGFDSFLNIDSYNWSLFKGYKVFFLAIKHSGYGENDIIKIGNIISKKLHEKSNVNLEYISYLPSHMSRNSYSLPPIVKDINISQTFTSSFCNYHKIEHELSTSIVKNNKLFSPLIFEKSLTLFHGNPNVEKNFFSITLGLAATIPVNLFSGWSAPKQSTEVLILNGINQSFAFKGKLKSAIKVLINKKNNKIVTSENLEKISENYINNNNKYFKWDAFDTNSDSKLLLDFIYHHVIKYNTIKTKLLILNELFDTKNRNYPEAFFSKLNYILIELKKRNWAVLIVESDKLKLYKQISFDNVVRFTETGKKTQEFNLLNIYIEKSFKNISRKHKKISCKIDLNTTSPIFQKHNAQPNTWSKNMILENREQLNNKIKYLVKTGKKGEAIAEQLGISLSMVKKIKSDLGLTRKRTQDVSQI